MNTLATTQDSQIVSSGEDMLRLAIEKGASVEIMERLLDMRTKLKAECAKEAYDKAMELFQHECPVIRKTRPGPKNAYRYAALEDIVEATNDLREKHGFSYKFTQGEHPELNWVKAVCKITHRNGHSEISEFKVPIDSKNPMMTDPQRHKGAMMFAKREAFSNGFGIVCADEDKDCVATAERPVGESAPKRPRSNAPTTTNLPHINDLKKELWAITQTAHRGDRQAFAQHLWDEGHIADTEHPEELGAERLAEVIAKVKAEKKELF